MLFKSWVDWAALSICAILLGCVALALLSNRIDGHPCRTAVLLKMLDQACQTYRGTFGAYPPGRDDFDSRPLHQYLGFATTLKPADGSECKRPPIVLFSAELLEGHPSNPSPEWPVPVVDEWDQPLRYANPGRHNAGSIDLWSLGSGGSRRPGPDDPDFPGLTNWSREY